MVDQLEARRAAESEVGGAAGGAAGGAERAGLGADEEYRRTRGLSSR